MDEIYSAKLFFTSELYTESEPFSVDPMVTVGITGSCYRLVITAESEAVNLNFEYASAASILFQSTYNFQTTVLRYLPVVVGIEISKSNPN